MRRLLLALAGGGMAVVLSALAIGTVFADPANEDPDGGTGVVDAFMQTLAGKLGIGEDELRDAVRETELDLLDQAVADGRISEDRAAGIRERIESGQFPTFGGRHGPGWRHARHVLGLFEPVDVLADVTGVDRDDVVAELRDGKSMAEVAEAHGVSRDELKTALTDRARESLDQAVADGKIDQEQADRMLEAYTGRLDGMIDRSCIGRSHEGMPEA